MTREILAALFLIAFCAAPAFAQQGRDHYPVGQVVKLEGKVWYVSPDGRRKSAKIDDPVFLKAKIETDAASKVLILFVDDTQITLGEKSELVIDEYIFDPYDSAENDGEFSILKGSFLWLSGMMSKGERPNVKIRTAAGSIGIRGTEFWSGGIDGGHGVLVLEGLVDFAGDWGSAEIPAGAGVFLAPGARETPGVKTWPKEKEERALLKTTFLEPGDLDDRLKALRTENIRKRHDLRGRLFPYKPRPPEPQYLPEHDEFFTDEFQKMRKEQ